METILKDIRYGIRGLLKRPGFTAIAVITLALGIGANTAIFSVVNAVLLKPLAYADSERLAIMWEKVLLPENHQFRETSVAYPNFLDWSREQSVFESFAVSRSEDITLTGAGNPERLAGRMVSADFFKTLATPPMAGRDFTNADNAPGAEPAVILAYGFWQRHFGGDPEKIINKRLTLDGRGFTVIGVTAPTFEYGATPYDVYVPIELGASDFQNRGSHSGFYAIGRMKPGVTLEQARAQMESIMAALAEEYPQTNGDRHIELRSLYENQVQDSRRSLLILLGAVGFVLLIACANVASLLLARAATRQKEIALRSVLGASRLRLVRQLLAESVLLSLLGGGVGLLFAVWIHSALIWLTPDALPRLNELSQQSVLNPRILGFAVGLSILTGVLFGIVPALQASKPELNEALKDSERGSSGRRHRLRDSLVIAEIALAFVLLSGAGLLLRSFWQLQQVPLGFDSRNLLTMQIGMNLKPEDGSKGLLFLDQLEERVRSLPGVKSVAFSKGLPFAGASENGFFVEGDNLKDERAAKNAVFYITSPDYFSAMGIRLLKGRGFTKQDQANSKPVLVIDEALARQYFPNQDPIGRKVLSPTSPALEIVGLVEHVQHYGLEGTPKIEAQVYVPMAQLPGPFLANILDGVRMEVRTANEPTSVISSIRSQVSELNNEQPVFNIRTMQQIVDESLAARRFSLWLLMLFGAVALLLASVGVYGLMSNSVVQRTQEIGIRMALGAQTLDVLKLVVGNGMTLTLIGVGIGLAGAFALTRLMTSLLFGVAPTDAVTLLTVSVGLIVVALFACYLPARRATKVDPLVALRYE
jgi:putative ABC transport system permease protein